MLTPPYYFEIASPSLFLVSGRDALRYLQARLSNDIRSLTPGKPLLAAMLTAQGKTEGLFSVIAVDTESFLLCASGADSHSLLTAFKRFIVADRVGVTDISKERALIHVVVNEELLPQLELATNTADKDARALYFPFKRGEVPGVDVVCSLEQKDAFFRKLESLNVLPFSKEAQELTRIRAGIPSFPYELNEETLFSESGYREAVSFNKGCYVGQEVIEKVDAIGKLARKLMRLTLEGDLTKFQGPHVVNNTNGEQIGRITSCAFDASSGTSICFAVIKNTATHISGYALNVHGLKGVLL